MSHWCEVYLGIPWRTSGRDVSSGLDCWGLLRYVYRHQFNIQLGDFPTSLTPREWNRVALLRDGDGVAMGRDKEFSHVGIYVEVDGEASILHAQHNSLSSIESIRYLRTRGWTNIEFYHHDKRP